MFLFRKRREASVKVIEPDVKNKSGEKEKENEKNNIDTLADNVADLTESKSSKNLSGNNEKNRVSKKSSKKKREGKEDNKIEKGSVNKNNSDQNTINQKVEEITGEGVLKEENKDERPIKVITSKELELEDKAEHIEDSIEIEKEDIDDEIVDNLLVPGNPETRKDNDESIDLDEAQYEIEEEDNGDRSDIQEKVESVVESKESDAEPVVKIEGDTESEDIKEDKDKDEDEEGGGNLFASLFGNTQVEEETPLDKLKNSLPEITIEEVINEAEDVNNIIHDWYQQQIKRR
jgi:hypothetical protein